MDITPSSHSAHSQMSSSSAAAHSPPRQLHRRQTKPPINPSSSFLAGIAGGSASTILLYPLDLIKVRMQVDERRRISVLNTGVDHNTHATTCAKAHGAERPRTICTTIRGVLRHEGFLGLYRGLTPAVIGSAASWGGFFILYEEIKRQMLIQKKSRIDGEGRGLTKGAHVDEKIDANTAAGCNTQISSAKIMQPSELETAQQKVKLGPIEHFSASCISGACMVALTNPLWLIKTRLQLQNSKLQQQLSHLQTAPGRTSGTQKIKPAYRGLLHAAYTIFQEEGFLALYKGSVPALMLVSHGGIQFVTYEFLKGHFAMYTDGKKDSRDDARRYSCNSKSGSTIAERMQNSLGYLIMGAVSKFVASTTTYPLQVIKARLQQRSQVVEVSETTGEIIVTRREYSGVIDCVRKIWKNEGANGFFKGCVTNAIRVAPSAALTFVTYEFVLDILEEK